MSVTDEILFTEGAEAAEAVADEIAASRPKTYRMEQIKIKDGDAVALRFVTDRERHGNQPGWITADTHPYIPTKDKPEAVTWKWPGLMWAICRNDKMFRPKDPSNPGKRLDEYIGDYGDCYIHSKWVGVKDEKFGHDKGLPHSQVYAIAVLREPRYRDEKRKQGIIGFTDKTVEWTNPDGEKIKIPHFVIVSQKYGNFFTQVAAACWVEPMTATNKDFMVSRKGNDYTVTPLGQTADFMTGTDSWKSQYLDVLEMIGFDLGQYILDHASLDHYRRFFIEGEEPEGGYGRNDGKSSAEGAEDSGTESTEAGGEEFDAEAMAAYRESLKNRK